MAQEYLAFATDLVHKAGDILLAYYRSDEINTTLKSDRSVVTQADVAVDQLISRALQDAFPGETILSEELQPEFAPASSSQNRVTWIVDPLDGTTNFSLGLPFWGVLIARLVNGWPETAISHFPLLQETYSAQRGKGTYLNGRPIRVAPPDKERPYTFFACCSRAFRRYQVNIPYKTRILGAAGYTYCMVARGAAILGFEATPRIWDLASAWLLVQEAGGIIETLDGSQPFPLHRNISYRQQCFPTLAASTPDLIAKARQGIIPK